VNSKVIAIGLMLATLVGLQTGCANLTAAYLIHDSRVETAQAMRAARAANMARVRQSSKALKVDVSEDGRTFYMGMDLLQAKGWLAAWAEEPGLMTGATTLDVATGAAVVYAAKSGGGHKSSGDKVTITGNGNTYGGRDVNETRTKTTTSTSSEGQ